MDSKIMRKKKTSFKDNVIKIREIMQGALSSSFVPDDNLWIHIFRQERLSRCLNGNLNVTSDFDVLTQAILEQVVDHEMKMQSDDHSPMKKHNSDSKMPTPPVDIIVAILQLKNLLLKLSPGLYNDIGAKLDFLLVDKRTACKTYSNFSEAMFEKCISWPLIVSFLLFSANLAAECIKNGRHKLVRNIYDWATLFTTLKLKGWIIENGGWRCIIYERSLSVNSLKMKLILSKFNLSHRGILDPYIIQSGNAINQSVYRDECSAIFGCFISFKNTNQVVIIYFGRILQAHIMQYLRFILHGLKFN
ncbi:uncharacterized protein LOC100213014 isoform X4 [Hydra vulgaris]|uniref:Uncharacterized protein LOC100213014 isoform X4 n=1 Tax=Hydra vulgaris TaxID=6087 RepID=A0ABM4BGG5_HYDVU